MLSFCYGQPATCVSLFQHLAFSQPGATVQVGTRAGSGVLEVEQGGEAARLMTVQVGTLIRSNLLATGYTFNSLFVGRLA